MSPKVLAFIEALEEFYAARLATMGHPYYACLAADFAAAIRYANKRAAETPS